MHETRNQVSNLFTFGCGQLQECLSQERKSKFPFLQNAKVKKTPLLHKMVSQQRQKIGVDNENNNDLNLPLTLKARGRTMSQGSKKVTFSLDKQFKQIQAKRESSAQNRHRKKASLPKVFKNIFPSIKPNSTTKKTQVQPQPSLRYLGEESSMELVQPFNMLESENHQSMFRDVRPKSVMFISENFLEIPEQKIKTIQHHRNRLYSKAYMSKPDQRLRVTGLNNKIIENINQFKKIYC